MPRELTTPNIYMRAARPARARVPGGRARARRRPARAGTATQRVNEVMTPPLVRLVAPALLGILSAALATTTGRSTRGLPSVYVSPTGSDAHGSGSDDAPFASIDRALSSLPNPGGQVLLLNGTFARNGPRGPGRGYCAPIRTCSRHHCKPLIGPQLGRSSYLS